MEPRIDQVPHPSDVLHCSTEVKSSGIREVQSQSPLDNMASFVHGVWLPGQTIMLPLGMGKSYLCSRAVTDTLEV